MKKRALKEKCRHLRDELDAAIEGLEECARERDRLRDERDEYSRLCGAFMCCMDHDECARCMGEHEGVCVYEHTLRRMREKGMRASKWMRLVS